MSSLMKMTMRDALPFIDKLYESFGVKSMILLKDKEWINVVTVIHLTRRKVEDLNNEYRFLEERLGKIDSDNFKIIIQARPIREFRRVVKELENGYLNIGDLHTKLLIEDPQKTLEKTISNASYVVRSGEYAEYNCYSVTLHVKDTTPHRILSNFGISPLALGLQDFRDLSRSWLGLDNLDTPINIHIIIPIYATVQDIQYQGGNEIKATLKMDQRLFDNSNIYLTRKGKGDNAPILERTTYDAASCDKVPQNGFIYVSLGHNFSAIGLHDRISVSLLHNELGLLDRQETTVVVQPETSDPLLQTFALFDAGKKMEDHLLDPKDSEDFVASVSWLLERINIRSLTLGRDETVRENKTGKGSADIIAYDPESKEVLVIDCTIGVPSEPKIDKIKSTAEYISRKTKFPVKAVIVTAKKASAAKELASKCYVKMIDNTDLEKLIGFYKKGKDYPARNLIRENI